MTAVTDFQSQKCSLSRGHTRGMNESSACTKLDKKKKKTRQFFGSRSGMVLPAMVLSIETTSSRSADATRPTTVFVKSVTGKQLKPVWTASHRLSRTGRCKELSGSERIAASHETRDCVFHASATSEQRSFEDYWCTGGRAAGAGKIQKKFQEKFGVRTVCALPPPAIIHCRRAKQVMSKTLTFVAVGFELNSASGAALKNSVELIKN